MLDAVYQLAVLRSHNINLLYSKVRAAQRETSPHNTHHQQRKDGQHSSPETPTPRVLSPTAYRHMRRVSGLW